MERIFDSQDTEPTPDGGCDSGRRQGISLAARLPESQVTLAGLRSYALERRREDAIASSHKRKADPKSAAEKKNINRQVNQFSSLLNKIAKLAPLGDRSPLRDILPDAESWAEEQAKKTEKPTRKHRQELKLLKCYASEFGKSGGASAPHIRDESAADQPANRFAISLRTLLQNSEYSIHGLAVAVRTKLTAIHVNPTRFWKWLNGINAPLKTPETIAIVEAIEELLSGEGQLVPHLSESLRYEFAREIPDDPKLRRRIREAVGRIEGLTRCEVFEKQRLALKADEERQQNRQPDYGLSKEPEYWPRQLLVGFRCFIQVLRDTTEPRPDDPEHDPDRFYLTCRDLDEDKADELRENIPGKFLRIGSLKIQANQFAHLFGWARELIDDDDLSFAYLACPNLIRKYFRFQKERRANSKPRGGKENKPRRLTRHLTRLPLLASKMLHMLAQMPEMAKQYRPVNGLISQRDSTAARKDWADTCMRAITDLQKLYRSQKDRAAPAYNDEVEIAGMLDQEEPLDGPIAIAETLQEQIDRLPTFEFCKCPKQRWQRATLLRDLMTTTFMMIPNAFRPGTGWRVKFMLDENGNPIGHVRFMTDQKTGKCVWYITAANGEFKNHDSPILKNGFDREVPDLLDCDHSYTMEYLHEARLILTRGVATDAFIVNTRKAPRHTARSYSEYHRRFTRRVLRQTGRFEYRGAVSISCNQARKLVGTSVAQGEGEEEAGNALMNRKPQIYTRVSAKKRSRATERHLARLALRRSRKPR